MDEYTEPSDRSSTAAPDLDADDAAMAVEVLRMLGDVTRLRLLWAMTGGELSVNALADLLVKPQAAVSQHLAKLRMAGLVQTRREGNRVFYRIGSEHIRQLVLDSVHHAEHATAGVPRHHRADLSGSADAAERPSSTEAES